MEDFFKPFEEKLKEEKLRQEQEERDKLLEDQRQKDGSPHLVNLNEDPFLDRKAQYFLLNDQALTLGRKIKGSKHNI